MSREYISIAECARRLNVCTMTVYRRAARGEIATLRTSRRGNYRIAWEHESWIEMPKPERPRSVMTEVEFTPAARAAMARMSMTPNPLPRSLPCGTDGAADPAGACTRRGIPFERRRA